MMVAGIILLTFLIGSNVFVIPVIVLLLLDLTFWILRILFLVNMEENKILDSRALSFEIESANPRCSLDDLKPELVLFLEQLYLRYPFHINSAYRSKEYEFSMKRDGSSSHCKGLAVDIRVLNSVDRLHLLRCAMELGCCRFGIASNYIHMDLDRDKQACIWTY